MRFEPTLSPVGSTAFISFTVEVATKPRQSTSTRQIFTTQPCRTSSAASSTYHSFFFPFKAFLHKFLQHLIASSSVSSSREVDFAPHKGVSECGYCRAETTRWIFIQPLRFWGDGKTLYPVWIKKLVWLDYFLNILPGESLFPHSTALAVGLLLLKDFLLYCSEIVFYPEAHNLLFHYWLGPQCSQTGGQIVPAGLQFLLSISFLSTVLERLLKSWCLLIHLRSFEASL